VADLDDAHCYSLRSKPRANPLDYSISAFYYLPSTRHAVSLTALQLQPRVMLPSSIDPAQFEDADL